ncbi:ribosome silencing factor [Micrococcoides hystricis]|uniref:Ribosomal silencing factor RsfS n=1 Tax=Micrococcoides hystricis TaxID=1572761 RepID=A0ABV6P7R3_9MICC
MSIPEQSLAEVRTAAAAAAERLAENIVGLDVAERLGIADAFLLAAAPTERQVLAIVDEIEDKLREEHELKPIRREGAAEGRWVLLDYGHIVVHVQHQEERAYYALERLYDGAPVLDLQLPETGESNTDETEAE